MSAILNSKLLRKEANVKDFTTKPPLPSPLAGFAVRWLALLIDNLIIMVVGFLIGLLLSFLGAWLGSNDFQALYGCLFCLSSLISAAYYVVCWTSLGAGPGGRLLGLRIVQRDGSPIDFGKALIRFLGSMVSSLVFSLGYLWAAFDTEKQTWHDNHLCRGREGDLPDASHRSPALLPAGADVHGMHPKSPSASSVGESCWGVPRSSNFSRR